MNTCVCFSRFDPAVLFDATAHFFQRNRARCLFVDDLDDVVAEAGLDKLTRLARRERKAASSNGPTIWPRSKVIEIAATRTTPRIL